MLNKILSQLNGHGTEAESLEAALAQLERDIAEATSALRELQEARKKGVA